VYVKTDIC